MLTKRLSRVRWFVLAAGLCAAGVLLAVETQEALITFTAGSIPGGSQPFTDAARVQAPAPRNFDEFIVDADGAIVGFANDVNRSSSAYRWRAGNWSKDDSIHPEGQVLDAIQAPDGKWIVLSLRSFDEVILYQYDGSSLSRIATVTGSPKRDGMALHRAADGTVWIASKWPIIYGVKDGKITTHEVFSESSYSIFSNSPYPLISLTAPGRGLWFWSFADYRSNGAYEQRAAKGFHVYEDGQWRTVTPSGGLLGGAVLIDSNTILCAPRNKGMFFLSLTDGSIKEVNWARPDKEGCVFLHSTPSHNILAITAQPIASLQLARDSDGALGKLVVFKDGKANVLLDGIDAPENIGLGLSYFEKGRPVVDTPQGTFIATMGRGIVFVSSDASQARRLDWRFNIPTSNVARMRVQGNLLYLLDRNTGLAIVDWKKLLRMPESPNKDDRWDIYTASTDPAVTPDGAIWWFDRGKSPRQLNCWRDGKLTGVSLESIRFNGQVQSIAADTKGGFCLLPQSIDAPVACFKHGEWRRFDNADAAWSSMALEEKDGSSFGFVKSCNDCPVFGGNGRVAYRDRMNSGIHYFDGAVWQATKLPAGISSVLPLFFENGFLTANGSSGSFQFIDGQWQRRSGQFASGSGAQPSSAGTAFVPPERFPGDKSRCRISLSDMANTVWAGNPEELYRGMEDVWVRFPTIGTPLFAATYLTQVLIDDSGDLWFVLKNGPSSQLAHYRDSGKALTIEWVKPPPAVTKTARTVFSCRVSQKMDGRALLSYRVDERPWQKIPLTSSQQEIVAENLPDGMHKIEARAFDVLLRSSPLLTSNFEVRRDYNAEIPNLILQLSDIEKREAAARALVSIGRPAVPALIARKEKADSPLRWWIQAVLDEISWNEKEKEK